MAERGLHPLLTTPHDVDVKALTPLAGHQNISMPPDPGIAAEIPIADQNAAAAEASQ